MARGGKRIGAGRKRKDRSDQTFFEDAESYLLAIVQGRTAPDALRISAAKSLILYQTAKKRAPMKSLPPAKLHLKTEKDKERGIVEDFEKRAAVIREKFQKKGVK